MRLKTFKKGGAFPPHHKEYTEHKKIEIAQIPAKVHIHLRQHAGAPAKPIVEVGQTVEMGEMIGEAAGFISAPVHSSVNGVVKSIAPYMSVAGTKIDTITIESSEEQKELDLTNKDIDILTKDEIANIVQGAGIVGLGGAAFPTYVKLTPPKEVAIDSLIVNGCECEPYLTCDHRVMLERSDELISGIKLLLKAVGAAKAYIGIENNKPDAIELLFKKVLNEPDIEVVPVQTKYPQGSEKHLIKAVVNREVKTGALPSSVGVLVQNVGTTVSIYEACAKGKPLIERVITVTGKGVKEPKNLRARIGTPVQDLLDECGGLTEDVAKIIIGGPMTGFSIYDTSVPVAKGTSGIVLLTKDEAPNQPIDPCVRCGYCVVGCPMGLQPLDVTAHIGLELIEEAVDLGLMNCIECGICSFVCPSSRPLVQQLKFGKSLASQKKG